MGDDQTPETEIPVQTNELEPVAQPPPEKWFWLRWVMAGNPFYLISAALLLFGINRLSVDPNFLEAEVPKLIFNFSALQLYEVLLVVVGIFLARRRLWYDAALLVGLESLLVLVPFILVTQALLIGNEIALGLCVAGTLLALVRFASLRRFVPELNMPPRLLGFGLILLLVNLALPTCYRYLLADGVTDSWAEPNRWLWFAGLPILQLLANGLPEPGDHGDNELQRRWLPIGMYQTWIVATAIHLWCLAYVDKLPGGPYLLAPTLWALAWTLYRRIEDFHPNPEPALRTSLLIAPALVTLLAAAYKNSQIFLCLTFLNVLVYGCLCFSKGQRRLAVHLLLVSGAALLAGMPLHLAQSLAPELSRGRAMAMACGAFVLLQSFWSKRAYVGGCGAIVAAMLPGFLGWEPRLHLGAQIAFAFLIIHSLRWAEREQQLASILRSVMAAAWMLHSLAFIHVDPAQGPQYVSAAATLVLLCYFGAWFVRGIRPAVVIPVAAVVSLLAAPTDYIVRKLMASPAGLLAIGGSFLLFGFGTVLALTRPRWHRPSPERLGKND